MKTVSRATIDDLYRVPDNAKAELVGGEIVRQSPTGGLPGRASAAIYASLRYHEKASGGGLAYPDNTGFVVDLPHRKSFSPDAAFHPADTPTMSFVKGAPSFAAEVRSEGDYGPRAEDEIARKRADYFAAGTLVVWDVDLVGENVVRVFRSTSPEPVIFRRGEIADAEPALPGWRMRVDELFE
jgi:Uma2 family endonuclease